MPKEKNCVSGAAWGVEARVGGLTWAFGLCVWTCASLIRVGDASFRFLVEAKWWSFD